MSAISVEAREEFASNEVRKETLGAIAGAALHRLLNDAGSLAPMTVLGTFVPVLRDRHLLLYSADPTVQATWRDLKFAGALPEPEHDALAVVVNNAAISKVDFYMEREVDYRVQLHRDGSASGRLRIPSPTLRRHRRPAVPSVRMAETTSAW